MNFYISAPTFALLDEKQKCKLHTRPI